MIVDSNSYPLWKLVESKSRHFGSFDIWHFYQGAGALMIHVESGELKHMEPAIEVKVYRRDVDILINGRHPNVFVPVVISVRWHRKYCYLKMFWGKERVQISFNR